MEQKYNKTYFKEGRCPSCGSLNISEIDGWCSRHENPMINDCLQFCPVEKEECYIIKITDAFFCDDCDNVFDDKKMYNFNDLNSPHCPVGRESEISPKEYADQLYLRFSEFKSNKIDLCLKHEFYIEAIVYLHRHIFEQLRYLLLKKIKGREGIPLDENDSRYKSIVPLFQQMQDSNLLLFAFIYQRINEDERQEIHYLNTIRNKFVHAWKLEERKKIPIQQVITGIKNVQKIEKKLDDLCKEIKEREEFINNSIP